MKSSENSRLSEVKAKRRLRSGFSTGTAAAAAARAALRHLLTAGPSSVIAVLLPAGNYLDIAVLESHLRNGFASASVIKDGGDDPDATNRAEVRATVGFTAEPPEGLIDRDLHLGDVHRAVHGDRSSGIYLVAGKGVGIVTKPGLPVRVGEPAINPVPRYMLARNLSEELRQRRTSALVLDRTGGKWDEPSGPAVFIPFDGADERLANISLVVTIEVPRGLELAERTLNPRLGIKGGISILGTTGLVKPFSHEAYEETVRACLKVAASGGCSQVVLSTGGKSENLAQKVFPGRPAESFVQIADFFAFAVHEAAEMGFEKVVHSVFFGKAVKMAQGHGYTHAHRVALDLSPVAHLAAERGYDDGFCRELAEANTARHALEILLARGAQDVIRDVARKALEQSKRIAGNAMKVRMLLFHHDGTLLADEEN